MSGENQKTILLVEDEAITAMSEKMILEKFGYKVIMANTGEEAVNTVEKTPSIDLILMDIELGAGIDGTEAAAIILQQRDLPVVFLSSHTEPEVVEKTGKITSYGYVVKNSSSTVLDASIKMAFKLFESKIKEKENEFQREAALKALRESEVHLKAQYQGMPLPTFTWQRQGEDFELIDYNDAAKVVTHEKVIEFVGRKASDLYANRQDILRDLQQCFVERKVIKRETASEHFVPGNVMALTIMFIPPDLVMVHIEDISERKQAEDTLLGSVEKYSILIENSHDIIFTLSTNGVFTFVSPSWTTLLGHPINQVVGKPFQQFVHPDDLMGCMIQMQKVIEMGQRHEGVDAYRVRHTNGSWRWFITNAVPIRDAAGTIVGGEGIARDITERKQAEEVTKNTIWFQQALLDAIPSPIFYKDAACVYIGGNKAFERYLGLSREQFIGKTVYDISPIDLAEKYDKADRELLKNQGVQSYEASVVYADGTRHDVVFHKAPFTNVEGNVAGLVGVILDITERKQAEEEIKRQLSEKEILLKEVHHRIKNNITSISGLLSLRLQSVANPEAVAVLQDAIGRVDSMRILYDKMLLSEDYEDISVKNYVENLIDTIVALFPGSAKVTVDKRIADFHLDPKRLFPLGLIINELITNKMKYAFINRKTGSIKISLANANNHVTLIIQDDGVGLPDGFDVDKSKGFGLMLVKMLSQQLAGSFSIENQAGTRSKIEFDI